VLDDEAEKLGIPKGYYDDGRDDKCRSFADAEPLVPEAKWRETYEAIKAANGGKGAFNSNLITRVFNQSNEGSCVGNMEAQFHQVLQARQFGKDAVTQLSASSAYKQIGFSPNSGANIGDALERGIDTGILPLDNDENKAKFPGRCMPHTGFRVPFPAGWKETAKHFRFDEFFIIRNRNELFSALLRGFPVGVGRSGHSILYLDLVWDDKWLVRYVNSWGAWGGPAGDFTTGFGYDSSRLFDSSARYAWTARSIVIPPWQQVTAA
jgi:hypothetical protein